MAAVHPESRFVSVSTVLNAAWLHILTGLRLAPGFSFTWASWPRRCWPRTRASASSSCRACTSSRPPECSRVLDAGFARLDAILVRKDSIRESVVDAIGGQPLPGRVRPPNPPRRGHHLYPPDKGGQGGCFFSREGFPFYPLKRRLFQHLLFDRDRLSFGNHDPGAFPRICGEALITPSRHPDEILCISFGRMRICSQLPSRAIERGRV